MRTYSPFEGVLLKLTGIGKRQLDFLVSAVERKEVGGGESE